MTSPRVSLLLLGLVTAVAQAVLLREAMAAIGGSELAWGAVLALWLAGMGLGARLGVQLGSPGAARAAPAVALLLVGGGVVLLRAAPALTGAAAGEVVTTWGAAWLWVAATLPAGLAAGLAFPALAAQLGADGGGEAYAREAAGALLGGLLFSFALAPAGSAVTLCLTVALVVTVELWSSRRLLGVAIAALAVVCAWPASAWLARAGWRWAARPGTLARWAETRHQRLELAAGEPAALYGNGQLLASFPDPYSTTPAAHLLMLLHPRPRRVLAVGALADGSLVPMLRHPLDSLELAEEDPALVRLLPEWYGPELAAALADRRVHAGAADPLRALRRGASWDLVALLDADPTSLRANRTRTVEFFAECRRRMTPNGILVVRTGVNDTYLGGSAGRLLAVLASTLRQVFPQVVGIPGERVLLVAGRESAQITLEPAALAGRWHERGLADPAFTPELLPLLLDPARAKPLAAFVSSVSAPANTSDRPRAVLLAAGRAEARGHAPLLRLALALEGRRPVPLAIALGVAVLGLLGLALTRRSPGPAAAAVVGFASLGWWLLLLALWQAAVGSVYAEVGALSAAFMGGLAAGAAWSRRWTAPERRLAVILGAGALLSLLIASGLPARLPRLAVPALLLAGGLLTGAAFAGVARLSSRTDPGRGAGLGFAADELGAGLAAMVVGLLALPWAGLAATAAAIALLELAAIPAVWRAAK